MAGKITFKGLILLGSFALLCGTFLLVELAFFGLTTTGGSPWELWFVAAGFLTLAGILYISAVFQHREDVRSR